MPIIQPALVGRETELEAIEGFLAGGDTWQYWNNALRKILVEHQIKDGDQKGNWGQSDWFQFGERSDIYHTTLLIMVLETYYRYYH